MKGYGQFCPIAVASEIVAERWTPLILREVILNESRRFEEIRNGLPLISRTLLVQRLRTLTDAGLIQSRRRANGRGHEYYPTPAAEEFREVLIRLGTWGQRWGNGQFDLENLDLGLLMWNLKRRVDPQRLPDRRVVVRFDFHSFPARCRPLRSSWLILDRRGSDVCIKDPMFDVDLRIRADASALARVWMGALTFDDAIRSRELEFDGPRDLARDFPSWFLLSRFAQVERPRATGTKSRGGGR